MLSRQPLSIYIHIPFCRTRCYYCDFNTYAGIGHLIDPYVVSLLKEIEIVSNRIGNENFVKTIYFGGGTPSIFQAEKIGAIIQQIKLDFQVLNDMEISMEMNPVGLTLDYLRRIHETGVNRISLGMQSASLEELAMLGRKHSLMDVAESVELARQAEYENFNLDIIFGLPGQTIGSFIETLESALQFNPPHLSLYALTVEEGTPLAILIDKGSLPKPDEDAAGDMYELAMNRLDEAGYIQYEISNWALSQKNQCCHNIQYWKNHDYLGFGAGAHSHYSKSRWDNTAEVEKYIGQINKNAEQSDWISPAAANQITNSRMDEIGETMMMGLRLTEEGVSASEFTVRFGMTLDKIFKKEIARLLNQNLVEWADKEDGPHLRLTRRGRMLGNKVFMQFLKDKYD